VTQSEFVSLAFLIPKGKGIAAGCFCRWQFFEPYAKPSSECFAGLTATRLSLPAEALRAYGYRAEAATYFASCLHEGSAGYIVNLAQPTAGTYHYTVMIGKGDTSEDKHEGE
jgi:hypothetical protein